MKIYIASSWKNVHAVEMLTALLRAKDHEVLSFVEQEADYNSLSFEDWLETDHATKCFHFDSQSAMNSDLVVYLGPSGKDAAAEVGMAYAKGVPIVGMYAKGEDFGLMRKMMHRWCEKHTEALEMVDEFAKLKAVAES